jgi:hypothetical protein
MKFIRLDADHFAYLVDAGITPKVAAEIADRFKETWPDKRLLVFMADEFIDLTGRYEVIPVEEGVR